MKHSLIIFFLVTLLGKQLLGQQETYTVTKAPFSSDKYDEYSPVFYKNGIVFTSNRGSGSFVDYSSSLGKSTFDISFIDTTKKVTWRKSRSFSKSLRTPFNDGPVTFSSTGDTIYFSRNLQVDGNVENLSSPRNKLGIFSAVREGKKWAQIREFRINNDFFNITTPSLSTDGSKLYFASDRPGGYGGSDIYYSQLKNGNWEDPVNLGPQINTRGNESYPFLNEAGEFFFSSDGHGGLGGKDIFVTKLKAGGWYPPVRLDAPVNSEFDDFGIVTDALMKKGYFSSNRGKSIDIYSFKTNFFSYLFCEPQIENQYCFMISDTGSIEIDTLRFKYVWDFGDKSKAYGRSANHCTAGPGNYTVTLDIIDKRSDRLFFRKQSLDIEIFSIDQPFINSPGAGITGETIDIDGINSYCPGYSIIGYFWDFGDGTNKIGDRVNHKFLKSGDFEIRLGVTLKSQVSGKLIKRSVSKTIRIFKDEEERASYLARYSLVRKEYTDIGRVGNIKVKRLFSAEEEYLREALFQVVILSSQNKIALNSNTFRKVPEKYSVKEIFSIETGYSYIVDQQMSLMATYPSYYEMIALGYSNTTVRIFVSDEPAEKELYLIKKNYNLLTDINIDAGNILTTSAYIMLDQVVNLMNKYPGIKLEVGVHTDNQGVPSYNLSLSQFRAQIIVNYLINRGVSGKRFTAKGYGGERPVTSNNITGDRRMNRRIDFIIF